MKAITKTYENENILHFVLPGVALRSILLQQWLEDALERVKRGLGRRIGA